MGQKNRKDEEKGQLRKSTRNKDHSSNTKKRQRNSKETVTCLYTNADAITNKFDELKVLIELHKPKIIAVTEVKPKNLAAPLTKASLKLDGFEIFPNKQCFTTSGRGVSVYISEDLVASTKEVIYEMGAESVWVNIINKDLSTTKVGCIYRSPNANEECNAALCQSMSALNQEDSDLIIVGDFNHPEVDWASSTCHKDEDHPASIFLEAVRDGLLTQHVKEPTRWREKQTPNTLDLILTNKEGLVSDIKVNAPLGKSDHGIITFKIHCTKVIQTKASPRYLYNKANYDQIRTELNVNWDHLMNGKDALQCWDIFKSELEKTSRNNIPRTTENNGKARRPLWMNQSALTKVKKKHAAWNRYLRTKDGHDYQMFARARNQAKWECQKARRAFEMNVAKQAKKNPKAFWQYVNSKRKYRDNVADLNINGGSATTDQQKAYALSDFYKKVFTQEDINSNPYFEERQVDSALDDINFTQKDVEDLLKELNVNKSQGPDLLHPRLLFEARREISRPLFIIFRKSLDTGTLPEDWKYANITPIYKNKGSKNETTNYRPVSLTSVVCKILEKVIRKQIVHHMKRNKLFSSYQHGFLEKRSCLSNLLTTMEDWTQILEDKGAVECVYLDFMKAFDTVPHQKLLKKLHGYQITGKVYSWISQFLTGRHQRVIVNGTPSKEEKVVSGVPQGSVLGPTLFLVFINDLPETVDVSVRIFADDTKIFNKICNRNDQEKLQGSLSKLEEWSKKWEMKFHPEKCKVLHIGKEQEAFQYKMTANGNPVELEYVTKEKDLGVLVDDTLSFEQHAEESINKANRILAIIRRSFTYLDKDMLLLLYKSLVRPHLEYGNVIWNPKLKRVKRSIEAVQRRATRMVPELAHLSYQERLEQLKLPTLVYRRQRADMLETYKILHNEYDIDQEIFFKCPGNSRTRGHSLKIFKDRVENTTRRHFFSNRVVNMWNELPEEVVSASKIDTFKERLDQYWSSRDWLYNYEAEP